MSSPRAGWRVLGQKWRETTSGRARATSRGAGATWEEARTTMQQGRAGRHPGCDIRGNEGTRCCTAPMLRSGRQGSRSGPARVGLCQRREHDHEHGLDPRMASYVPALQRCLLVLTGSVIKLILWRHRAAKDSPLLDTVLVGTGKGSSEPCYRVAAKEDRSRYRSTPSVCRGNRADERAHLESLERRLVCRVKVRVLVVI